MSTSIEVLEAEALKLAPADRSHLLERLIASLDPDPEVEEAWEREADRREAELESGAVAAVPGHEAMARLRSKLSPVTYSLHPGAEQDIADALDFYAEHAGSVVAQRFFSEFERVANLLVEYPGFGHSYNEGPKNLSVASLSALDRIPRARKRDSNRCRPASA